jgi:hypothetical protein
MAADTPSTPPPPAPATRTKWSAGRILLVVLGSVVALLGAGLLAAGGALLWADQTQRDDEGFLTTPTERFERDSYAIVSDNIDLFEAETGSDWILSDDVLGDVRLRSENVEGGDTFVGIAPTAELNSYLGTVEHDEVTDLDFDPFSVSYRRISGGEPTGPPTEQTFWAASAAGPGEQTATWEPESGDWTIVVMNADGSRGVAVELSAGADANFLLWLAIGLMIAGVLVLGGGVAMIVFGARGAASGAAATAAVVPGAEEARPSVYPVALRGELDAGLSRWLWIVKWLLAIPHYIVLAFLWIAFWILSVIAFFAILFTGRRPALDVARRLLHVLGARHRSLSALHARPSPRLSGGARDRVPGAALPLAASRQVDPRHPAPDPRRDLRGRLGLGLGLGRQRHLGRRNRRAGWRPGRDRRLRPALHGALPPHALRLRPRARPLGLQSRGLREPHA